MDEELCEQNLNTLEEMLMDEEKLVTYLSLSKDLCIHVNSSKKLLSLFVNKFSKNHDIKLNVMYILSGLLADGLAKTFVCSADELEKKRSQFKLVFFEHVYSICKGTVKVDDVALCLVDKFEDFVLCCGLIKNDLCAKRPIDEINSLKSTSQETVRASIQKAQAPSKSFFGNKKVKEEKNESAETKNAVEKKTMNGKAISEKSSEKGIANITKTEEAVKIETTLPQSNGKPKTETKNQKGIAGFFNKQNGAPSKKQKTIEIKKEVIKTEIVKPDKTIKIEQMDVDEQEKTPVQKPNSNNGKETKNKSKSKLNQIKQSAKVDKKRKRLLHVSDSESDNDDPFVDVEEPVNKEDSEDEIPPTPNVSTVKITSGIVNPKKKRKIVDKTYTDEDGYILTKKVEVYESCSEHEDEADSKENVVNSVQIKKETSPKQSKTSKPTKKKISPPQKGKQANIMSFFQKK